MTRKEKKEELVSLFAVGAIYIGDLIDECFEFEQQHPRWISVEDELTATRSTGLLKDFYNNFSKNDKEYGRKGIE